MALSVGDPRKHAMENSTGRGILSGMIWENGMGCDDEKQRESINLWVIYIYIYILSGYNLYQLAHIYIYIYIHISRGNHISINKGRFIWLKNGVISSCVCWMFGSNHWVMTIDVKYVEPNIVGIPGLTCSHMF